MNKPDPLNCDLYETFNTLGVLVGKYGFDQRHPAIEKGARYVFSCQVAEGDYRGIYGRQPAHTYTAALMEVLIQAGYQGDPSIERAFRWLLDSRQDDGGWALPARTRGKRWDTSRPVQADTSKPFSHMVTGMVLRPFAAHPRYRRTRAAEEAAALLKSRLFKPDKYTDRRGREYWTKFTYPFVYTDLLTSLDTLGRMGFEKSDPDIESVIAWFREQQNEDGSFNLVMRRGLSDKRLPTGSASLSAVRSRASRRSGAPTRRQHAQHRLRLGGLATGAVATSVRRRADQHATHRPFGARRHHLQQRHCHVPGPCPLSLHAPYRSRATRVNRSKRLRTSGVARETPCH